MASSTEPTPKKTAFLPDPKDDLEPEIQRSTPEPTTHRANCHCGAIRYTVTLKYPFPKYKINRCTCSICTKNGYLLVYPPRKDVVWLSGQLFCIRSWECSVSRSGACSRVIPKSGFRREKIILWVSNWQGRFARLRQTFILLLCNQPEIPQILLYLRF
jgi:hypothetical protein